MVFWIQLTVFFLAILSITGGNDVIVTDDAPCQKGEIHTITCELHKRWSVVEWKIEDDVNPIILCQENSCKLNPNYEGLYSQSCDSDKNVFNLTILDVDENNNGKKFVCSDGTNTGCKVLRIGEYEQRLEETENGTITATSACSSHDRNVLFKWKRIDAKSREVKEFKPKILNRTATVCSNDCGKSTHIRHTEAFSVAHNSDNGTKYYLKMEVFYGNEIILSKTTTAAYIIEEQAADTKYEESEDNLVYLFFLCLVPILAVFFFGKRVIRHCCIYFKRAEIQKEENEGKELEAKLAKQTEAETVHRNCSYDSATDRRVNVVLASNKVEESTKNSDDELVETQDDIERKENVEEVIKYTIVTEKSPLLITTNAGVFTQEICNISLEQSSNMESEPIIDNLDKELNQGESNVSESTPKSSIRFSQTLAPVDSHCVHSCLPITRDQPGRTGKQCFSDSDVWTGINQDKKLGTEKAEKRELIRKNKEVDGDIVDDNATEQTINVQWALCEVEETTTESDVLTGINQGKKLGAEIEEQRELIEINKAVDEDIVDDTATEQTIDVQGASCEDEDTTTESDDEYIKIYNILTGLNQGKKLGAKIAEQREEIGTNRTVNGDIVDDNATKQTIVVQGASCEVEEDKT